MTAGERSYVILLPDGSKTLLPIWMTEAASAPAGTLTKVPHVCVAALEALRALLDQTIPPGQGAGRR